MSFLKDNASLAVRKTAATWAACRAEKPVWSNSVLDLNEAIDNAMDDLEDKSVLDPMFFLLSKLTGRNSRAIVAIEIVANQVQAHPGWFPKISDEEKFGDLDPDRLLKSYLEYRKEALKAKERARTDKPKDRKDLKDINAALQAVNEKEPDSTGSNQ